MSKPTETEFRSTLESTGVFSNEEIESKCKEAIAKGLAVADAPVVPPAEGSALLKSIEDATEAWLEKGTKTADDDGPEDVEGEADDDDDGGTYVPEPGDDDDDDDAPLNKAGESALSADAASALIAKAVNEALAEPLARIFKALGNIKPLAKDVEKIGNLAWSLAKAQGEALAKGSTPQADPAVLERLIKIEKAIGQVEGVLKQPASGFRGVYDPTDVEVIDRPGDENGSKPAMNKAGLSVPLVQAGLREQAKAAIAKGNSKLADELYEEVENLSFFPGEAAAVAAKRGIGA